MPELPEIRVTPFDLDEWKGEAKSIDGTATGPIAEDDVAEVLYHGESGDEWDGTVAAVVRLNDGRLVAWETFYGPTGDGFHEDAYGGEADLWFASSESLNTLVLQALTDEGRRLCGIPVEGLS